jgi:hypothetical protein
MVLSAAAKASRAAARRAASTVKTGPRKGQTRSDRLVERSSARSQRGINKQLRSDQNAVVSKRRKLNSRNQRPLNKGSDDRSFGEIRADAEKKAAIEKARRAKARGGMYFGLGAAGVAGTGFFGQQAHAEGPTHLHQKRGYNPPFTIGEDGRPTGGTDAGIIETIKRSKTGYNVFGDGMFMNMDADDVSTYSGITGRRGSDNPKQKTNKFTNDTLNRGIFQANNQIVARHVVNQGSNSYSGFVPLHGDGPHYHNWSLGSDDLKGMVSGRTRAMDKHQGTYP